MVPDWLGAEHMDTAQEALTRKRGGEAPKEKEVRLEAIYLSDPRRSAPGKLKTILRQPVGADKDSGVSPQ